MDGKQVLAETLPEGTQRSLPLGKGRIIYSPIDLTSGLLGTNTLGILGYKSPTACSLVKNVIIQSQNNPR